MSDARRPSKLRIGPFDWRLATFDEKFRDEEQADGICEPEKLWLGTYENLLPLREVETTLHEILHACVHTGGLEMPVEVEERIVLVLGLQLTQVLRDNPKFLTWLVARLARRGP